MESIPSLPFGMWKSNNEAETERMEAAVGEGKVGVCGVCVCIKKSLRQQAGSSTLGDLT